MPLTLVYVEGYEHQTASALRFGGGTTTGIFTTVTGSQSFVTGRDSGTAIRFPSAASSNRCRRDIGSVTGHRIVSFYLRMSQHPSAQMDVFDMNVGGTGADLRVETSGFLRPTIGGVNKTVGSIDVADGNWHLIDYYLNTTANPWVMDLSVDGVYQPQETQAIALDTTNVSGCWVGHSIATASGATQDYDDFVGSTTAGEYPIGPHRVKALVPTSDGTHNPGVNSIEDQSGNDIGAVTAYNLMDEWPANTTDYVRQITTSGGNYAEVLFGDIPADSKVIGVQGYAAAFAATTTATAGNVSIRTAAGVSLVQVIDNTVDVSETVLHYRAAVVPAPGSNTLWSPADVNALRAQVGRSIDVDAGGPQFSALMLQVAVSDVVSPAPRPSGGGWYD